MGTTKPTDVGKNQGAQQRDRTNRSGERGTSTERTRRKFTETWTCLVLLVVLGIAFGAHFIAVRGLSWGTVGAVIILLYLLLFERTGPWWKSPAFTAGGGFLAGFILIFLVEICLAGSAAWYGPIYPSERLQTWPEHISLELLAWVYNFHLKGRVELLTLILSVVLLAFGEFVVRWGKGVGQHGGEAGAEHGEARGVDEALTPHQPASADVATEADAHAVDDTAHAEPSAAGWKVRAAGVVRWISEYLGEPLVRLGEFLVPMLVTLNIFTFSNAINIDTDGLSAFVATYTDESNKFGSKLSKRAALQLQVDNIEMLRKELNQPQQSPDSKELVEAIKKLVAALDRLDARKQLAQKIDRRDEPYDPEPVTDDAVKPYPENKDIDASPPAKTPPMDRKDKSVLSAAGKLHELVKKSQDADSKILDLARRRDGAISETERLLLDAVGSGGSSEQRRQRLIEGIARLVAEKGVREAIETINKQISDFDTAARDQDADNTNRGQDIARVETELANYYDQQKKCADIGQAIVKFLQEDPDGPRLVQKLNGLPKDSPQRERLRPTPVRLLTPPEWTTGDDQANEPLMRKIERDVSVRVLGPPAADLTNYQQALMAAYRTIDPNIEGLGLQVLKNRLDASCSNGIDPTVVVAQLKRMSQTL